MNHIKEAVGNLTRGTGDDVLRTRRMAHALVVVGSENFAAVNDEQAARDVQALLKIYENKTT